MTRLDVDLGVLLGRKTEILYRHRHTMLAGFLHGADLFTSRFQVDFSPNRTFFPGQATPIFDLDDERLLFTLHDGPVEKGR